jgi:Cys-rich protein (TIGR01571 family)
MAIVPPPTDPAQFSASIFTPSPQSIKGGSWQHGFCSCAEPSICMTALFCPCIVYGKTQYRLSLRDEKKDPTNMLGYTTVNGSCMAFGILCGINGILAGLQRTRLRKKYSMSNEAGDVAGDCLKGVCCCCCVVAQDEKEIKFREEQARKPAGSGTKKEGYVAPTTMTFSPPPR